MKNQNNARPVSASCFQKSSAIAFCVAVAAAMLAAQPAAAQLARKPSYYQQQNQQQSQPLPEGPAAQLVPRPSVPSSLPALRSQGDFDQLARVYDAGTPMQLAHVLFVVDRQAKPPRMYYIDTPRYQLHVRFLRDTRLAPNTVKREIDRNYLVPERRFLFGTLSWQQNIGSFTYEFWEGDKLTAPLLRQAEQQVRSSFFGPVKFKTNSTLHERVAKEAGIDFVSQEALIREQPFLPMNLGTATGRVRIVEDDAGIDALLPDDIAVLRQVPIGLPPVAAVLTERPSTALSHVNLLAKGWGVPNAYLKDASDRLRALDGQWVRLAVTPTGWTAEARPAPATLPTRPAAARIKPPNLKIDGLLPLADLGNARIDACGGKAGRLGQIERERRAGRLAGTAPVPDGFCIPYAAYRRFVTQPAVAERIAAAYATPGFERSRVVRRQALEALRRELVEQPVPAGLAADWRARWTAQLESAGVFVRSSSNSEDLAGFSGAGLYSTVPNVTRADDLDRAVRTVWASVFNFEAVEARRQARIPDDAVVMAVFVQRAIDSASAGVLITRDPFDATHRDVVYVSAKRGIGIKVVEGKRVAEQSMWDARSGAVRRLSRSAEDTELKLDRAGGVMEQALPAARDVLSDDLVRRLGRIGLRLRAVLGGEQDVEWAIDPQGRIVVLQARPFVERQAP